MTERAAAEFVIEGMTVHGAPFRPSDWAERLCGVLSTFGNDRRLQYSPYAHPVNIDGVHCVVVDLRLEQVEPMAYRFLLGFARDNELRTRHGRVAERTELARLQSAGQPG
jgi:Protein of unknown function (DUF3579)